MSIREIFNPQQSPKPDYIVDTKKYTKAERQRAQQILDFYNAVNNLEKDVDELLKDQSVLKEIKKLKTERDRSKGKRRFPKLRKYLSLISLNRKKAKIIKKDIALEKLNLLLAKEGLKENSPLHRTLEMNERRLDALKGRVNRLLDRLRGVETKIVGSSPRKVSSGQQSARPAPSEGRRSALSKEIYWQSQRVENLRNQLRFKEDTGADPAEIAQLKKDIVKQEGLQHRLQLEQSILIDQNRVISAATALKRHLPEVDKEVMDGKTKDDAPQNNELYDKVKIRIDELTDAINSNMDAPLKIDYIQESLAVFRGLGKLPSKAHIAQCYVCELLEGISEKLVAMTGQSQRE